MASSRALQPLINYSDTFSFVQNIALFHLLRRVKGGFVTSPLKNYRLGLIIVEILNYVGQEKLLRFPSTIICDEHMKVALKVTRFELSQLPDIVYSNARLEAFPRFEPHEEFILQSLEKATILRLIFEISQRPFFFNSL